MLNLIKYIHPNECEPIQFSKIEFWTNKLFLFIQSDQLLSFEIENFENASELIRTKLNNYIDKNNLSSGYELDFTILITIKNWHLCIVLEIEYPEFKNPSDLYKLYNYMLTL